MWRPLAYSLAIVLTCLAAAAGGFIAGRSGGADLAGAARNGTFVGNRDGAHAGTRAGALAGYRAGYQAAYHHTYGRAYRRAYKRELGK